MAEVDLDLTGIARGKPRIPEPIADALSALQTGVNNIDDSQISPTAGIVPTKIGAGNFPATAFLTTGIGARAYMSANQTIDDNTWTKVQLNAESFDIGSDFDIATNYVFTVPATGYYSIVGSVLIDSAAIEAGKVYGARVMRNDGAADGALSQDFAHAGVVSQNLSIPISDMVYLEADWTVWVEAISSGTTGDNTQIKGASASYTHIAITPFGKA